MVTEWRHVGGGNIVDQNDNEVGQFIGDFRRRDQLIIAMNEIESLRAKVREQAAEIDEYHQVAMNHIHANEELKAEISRRERVIDELRSIRDIIFQSEISDVGYESFIKLGKDNDEITRQRDEAMQDAARWGAMSGLMFLGDVSCTQDSDGGYRIELDPAENLLGVSWEGNSPEEAIDAARKGSEK